MLALILALIFVLTVVPTAVFVGLRGKAEGEEIEELGPVTMTVIANGRTFTTAEVPAGVIEDNLDDITFEAELPNGCQFEKALVVGTDGTQTPISQVGSLGGQDYYSINKNTSTGTALDTETQHFELVYAAKYNVTLLVSEGGAAETNAITKDGATFIWGGDDLVIQATPYTDYTQGQITYKVGDDAAKAVAVKDGSATISNLSIYDDIIVSVNFNPVSSYSIQDARYMSGSTYYPQLKGIDNHGGTTTTTEAGGSEGMGSVTKGGTAEFYIYSESNTGGNEWLLNMLSINGKDVNYPFGEDNSVSTTLREATNDTPESEATVTLVDLDAGLKWKSGDYGTFGNQRKERSLYKVVVTNVHENLEVAYHFKEKQSREIIMKDLRGIAETGASKEERGDNVYVIAESRNYKLNKTADNVYPAYYNNRYNLGVNWLPSANLYLYRVKPGFNPYSVSDTIRAEYINDDTGAKTTVTAQNALSGNSSADVPDVVIKAAAAEITAEINAIVAEWQTSDAFKNFAGNLAELIVNWDSALRFWGPSSQLTYNNDTAYRKAYGIGKENEALLLQSIIDEERADSSKKWYAIALTQREETNQQLYLYAEPYQYHVVIDLDLNSEDTPITDNKYNSSGDILTEKNYHTLENGATYAVLPANAPTKDGYVFDGYQLYYNDEIVDGTLYQANEQFPINDSTVAYASGNERENTNHVFSLKAKWTAVEEAPTTKTSVDVYVQVPADKASEEDVALDEETGKYYKHVVKEAVETQVAGAKAILLDRHEPENAEFYEIREGSIVEIESLNHLGITGAVPNDNKFVVHWDIVQADLSVRKEVVGRLKTNEFPIKVTLTPPDGYPFTLAETRSFMELSDNEALGNIKIEDGKLVYNNTYVNGSEKTMFNAPGGWTYTIEEQVSGNEFETFISNGTEELEGRTFSRVLTTDDTNIVVRNQRKYDDPNLETDKWLTKTSDGYDLTMEAYATARTITEESTNTTPLDIVLVIDQSGSMINADMNPTFVAADKTSWTASDAAGSDTTYYYKVGEGEDAVYYPVQSDVGPIYKPAGQVGIKKIVGSGNDRVFLTVGLRTWVYPYYSVPTNYYFRDSNDAMHKVYSNNVGAELAYYAYLFYYNDEADAEKRWIGNSINYTGVWNDTYLTNNNTKWSNLVSGGKVTLINDLIEHTPDGTGLVFNSDQIGYAWTLPITGWTLRNDKVEGLYKKVSNSEPNHLYYVDESGQKNYIGNGISLQEDDIAYEGTLYTVSGGTTRLQALKDAANAFAETVADNAKENDITHKIAVAGFAGNATPGISLSEGIILNNENYKNKGYDYVNTGIFVADENDNYEFDNYERITGYTKISDNSLMDTSTHYYIDYAGVKVPIVYLQKYDGWYRIDQTTGYYYGVTINNNTNVYRPDYKSGGLNDVYDDAFLDVAANDGTVNPILTSIIDGFGAYGATYTSYGMSMANAIFEANTSNEREKVVVVFTDGEPGKSGYDDAIAGEALNDSQLIKAEDIKVYTVGLFVGNPSSDVDAFMSNLSSEGKTTRENVSSSNLDSDKTYWYYDSSKKKTYAVTTIRDGESTLGWWTNTSNPMKVYHEDDDSDDNIPSSQKKRFYNGNSGSGYTSIGDIDTSSSYYVSTQGSTGSNRVRIDYKYQWFNSENEIVSPSEYQFFELSNDSSGDSNNYYYHSDNPDGLTQIFENISKTITTTYNVVEFNDQNAKLKDTVTADFDLPDTEEALKQITKVEIVDVDHYEADGTPVFKPGQDVTEQYQSNIHWTINSDGTKTVEVDGFNYAENYISSDRTGDNLGKKLVVKVEGLTPNPDKPGGIFESNTDDSGLYRKETEDSEEKFIDAFPVPSISRYKYDLVVGDEDTDATFNVDFKFTGYAEDGTEEALANDLSFGGLTFNHETGVANWSSAAKDGDSIIFEQILTTENNSGVKHFDSIPDNYLISTNVATRPSNEFKYTMKLNDEDQKNFDEYYDMPKADATINISSTTKKYPVTVIKKIQPKEGDPDYTDKTKEFDIVITLYDKDGESPAPAGMYDGIEFTTSRGKTTGTITLSNDERETFTLPYGYSIFIDEDEAKQEQYIDSYWEGNNDKTDEFETGRFAYPITAIDEHGKDITVINTLEAPDIASGVLDSSSPFAIILIAMAAIIVLTATGVIIYLRKKEE